MRNLNNFEIDSVSGGDVVNPVTAEEGLDYVISSLKLWLLYFG